MPFSLVNKSALPLGEGFKVRAGTFCKRSIEPFSNTQFAARGDAIVPPVFELLDDREKSVFTRAIFTKFLDYFCFNCLNYSYSVA